MADNAALEGLSMKSGAPFNTKIFKQPGQNRDSTLASLVNGDDVLAMDRIMSTWYAGHQHATENEIRKAPAGKTMSYEFLQIAKQESNAVGCALIRVEKKEGRKKIVTDTELIFICNFAVKPVAGDPIFKIVDEKKGESAGMKCAHKSEYYENLCQEGEMIASANYFGVSESIEAPKVILPASTVPPNSSQFIKIDPKMPTPTPENAEPAIVNANILVRKSRSPFKFWRKRRSLCSGKKG